MTYAYAMDFPTLLPGDIVIEDAFDYTTKQAIRRPRLVGDVNDSGGLCDCCEADFARSAVELWRAGQLLWKREQPKDVFDS